MERPWWLLAFLLPLCCGSKLLVVFFGLGTAGLAGGFLYGGSIPGPWAALALGAFMGLSFSVPLIMVSEMRIRKRAACHAATSPA